VELTLIQIAQLTQEEDTPAAGRSPKRLKSLFHKMMGVQQKAASQGAAERPQPPVHPASQHQDAQPVAPPPAAKAPSARPALKFSNIGSTFANMRKTPEKTQYTREEEPRETGEQQPFDDDQLLLQWMSMCNRMPQQMAGLAARMKNMTPHIEQFPNVVVAVDNQLLLDQMKSIKNKVRNTLVRDLHNSSITLELRLARTEEMARALTRRELFDEMRKKNAALDRLCQALDLELA
jgi:DNA polymerase-3 subunit gamma/tau